MAERKAVTKTIATRYKRADKVGKARILDELCATTGGIAITPARRCARRCGRGGFGRARRGGRSTGGRKSLRR